MKKLVLAFTAALAVALTACTTTRSILGTGIDPLNPRVYVVSGGTGDYIIVDQEPIVVTQKGMSKITWHLATRGYEFNKGKGIVITSSKPSVQLTGCAIVTPTQFACDNNNNGKGKHTYEISLDGPKGPLKVDPSFFND